MIQVQALTKLYGDFVAVNDLSFDVQPGNVLGLVGPNGAGKTTTLRCLSGIIPATQGAVRLCGHDLKQDPISAKRHLSFFLSSLSYSPFTLCASSSSFFNFFSPFTFFFISFFLFLFSVVTLYIFF